MTSSSSAAGTVGLNTAVDSASTIDTESTMTRLESSVAEHPSLDPGSLPHPLHNKEVGEEEEVSVAPLADAETLTASSLEDSEQLRRNSWLLETSKSFISGGHSRDITVDSELPSLPADGVRLSAAVSSSEHQPVSLSDIDLTMVKP